MFIKLPSGLIIQIEKIVRCIRRTDEDNVLNVWTVEDADSFTLRNEDAKRLYEYLESIAIE